MATKTKSRIILVGGEKGGTGKTTLATNLAASRALAGHDVLIVDTDPQGSASGWCLMRDETNIHPRVASIQKFGKGLGAELLDLAKRYQDIIVDAGGRDSVELRAAMTCADMIVSPVQASSFDLWTLKSLDNLVSQAQAMNPQLKALVVMSRASTNPSVTDTQDASELVADQQSLKLSKAIICDRTAYRRAAGAGLGVVEYTPTNSHAIQEVNGLYQEVYAK